MIEHLIGSQITHHKTVARWRAVHCMICGADFAYEQTVQGSGGALNLFHITYHTSTKTAENKAVRDLNKKLQCMDHSPIPCPSCASYQPEMCKEAASQIGTKRAMRVFCGLMLGMFVGQILFMYLILSNPEFLSKYTWSIFLGMFVMLSPIFLLPILPRFLAPGDINSHAYKTARMAEKPGNILYRNEFENRLRRMSPEMRQELGTTARWS
ncbi:MAG: hypothetical protein ACAI35_22770 [Candidatus Methylacidiphilales bacterium]|nr:hypothetical protein [Candidatus Methylacidiphilales bacterium]